MAKSPEEIEAAMVEGLKEKTGKSLAEWTKLIPDLDAKHGEILKFLKEKHGVTHGYANLIVHKAKQQASPQPPPGGDDLLEAQYAGGKAALRAIYEALIKLVNRFGKDVEVSPKKTYVSLRRAKQFALIQPSTATRVDVGINLKGTPPSGRLEASGSFNAMVTHRVRVSAVGEVNKELETWLRQAYELAS